MRKVLVEFDSIEQAQAAIFAVSGQQAPAPAPHFQPNTAPQAPAAQVYAQAAPVQQYAPQPDAGFIPPMPQGYAPQAPAQAPAAPLPPQAPPQAGGAASNDGVVKAAQAYAKKFGPAATKAVLQQFGAEAVKDVKPEHFAAVVQALAV